ncbi:MAG: GNAT family N-acetyltransferase [Janthinobacterium lividum]
MNTPALQGYGVRLEPVRQSHTSDLQAIATDPSIWRFMNLRLTSAEEVRAWVEDSIGLDATEACQVWVTRLESGPIIGSSRLLDLQGRHRTSEIGFTWLAAPYRGAGVNPRVKLLQLTHAFETLRLRRVALKTHHENLQSRAAILKLGASYEGTFRNHMLMPDGSTRHTAWYSIIAEEWPEVKAKLLDRVATQPLSAL